MPSKIELFDSLSDKEYRDLYVSEVINSTLAAQIRAIREGQEMTQAQLGERAEMAQESISKLEHPDYGRYSLNTLKRLASGLDVALVVRFAPFSEFADWIVRISPDKLAPASYEEERLYGFQAESGPSTVDEGISEADLSLLAAMSVPLGPPNRVETIPGELSSTAIPEG